MFLAMLAIAVLPVSAECRESCPEIEINHFYADDGRLVFTQAIFWEWRDGYRVVRDWRMLKEQRPRPTARGWTLTLWDSERLRIIDAPVLTLSWTQEDVEIRDRERWPMTERSLLRK